MNNKTEKTTKFEKLVKAVEASPTDGQTLFTLATAVAFCVLKKIEEKTTNLKPTDYASIPTYDFTVDLKRQLTADLIEVKKEVESHIEFNANGQAITIIDSDYDLNNYQYGLDLVQEVNLSLWQYIKECIDNSQAVDLSKKILIKKLSKKVYFAFDFEPDFKEVESTPIQEAFKACRRYIENERKNTHTSIYAYTDGGEVDGEEVYIRLPKYSDIGGYIKDFNGKYEVYTVGDYEADKYLSIMDKLKVELTSRQLEILKLAERGNSQPVIGKILGISHQAVCKHLAKIEKAAEKIGLKP